MMALFGAVILVAGFIIVIKWLKLVEKSLEVIQIAKSALTDLQNPQLHDDAKEVALQKHAKQLFILFFLLTLGGLAALMLPAGLVWLLDQVGILSFNAVMAMILSWPFILASTVLVLIIFLFRKNNSDGV